MKSTQPPLLSVDMYSDCNWNNNNANDSPYIVSRKTIKEELWINLNAEQLKHDIPGSEERAEVGIKWRSFDKIFSVHVLHIKFKRLIILGCVASKLFL